MSGYISIDDPVFDRLVTLREAYKVMEHFVAAHVERGVGETDTFFAYFALLTDRRGADPAALYDYLDSVAAVLDSERRPLAGEQGSDAPAG